MFILPLVPLVFLLAALLPSAVAQQCSATNKCPQSAPCCSPYGYCGSGSYCLGGCEPLYSNTLTSCLPNPICTDTSTDFRTNASLARVQTNGTLWNGNASAYDWVVDAGVVAPTSDGLRLTLSQDGAAKQGTKISSTRYLHYGSIQFTMEASHWAGVVSAAIMMSDVKDEIDLEWPGAATGEVQTNYWFMGIANYSATEGQPINVSGNTATSMHMYQVDWHEDQLVWSVDGQVVRTVMKNDTLDSATGQYKYPSTPSRVQISIWPAGLPSSANGTITWAGGLIDWSDPDYTASGFFWNTIQSVNVFCQADPGANASTTGWAYGANDSAGVPTVQDTERGTVLLSNGGGRGVVGLWQGVGMGVAGAALGVGGMLLL